MIEKSRKQSLLIALALALITFIAYEPVRHHEFIYLDDTRYVSENPHVLGGWTGDNLMWAFTSFTYAGNFHPLTWLSHMLDCELFELNAGRHHLISLLIHIVNTLLLFGILKRMTRRIWPGGLVALLFALHPLHIESVAWIAERKDVLSGFFFMLTSAAYIHYAARPTLIRFLGVFLSFTLGLLAKPMLVTLPFVLLLLDYWPLERFPTRPSSANTGSSEVKSPALKSPTHLQSPTILWLIAEKIPLFVLAAVSCLITFMVQQATGAVKTTMTFPLDARLSNALISYVTYLYQAVYPVHLAVLYPHAGEKTSAALALLCLGILIITTVGLLVLGRRRRYLNVGWLWYLGTLVPVIGLVQVGVQAHADRYTYLPLIGIFMLVIFGAADLVRKFRIPQLALILLVAALLASLLYTTRRQVRHWRNSATLFEHTLVATENNYPIHNNYGNFLCRTGQLDQGIIHLQECLRIFPGHLNAHINLALAYYQKRQFVHAIDHYEQALLLLPHSFEALNNLAWIYATCPQPEFRNGPEAVRLARRACELTGFQSPLSLGTLAAAYAEAAQFPNAVQTARQAIDLFRVQGLPAHADNAARQLKLYQTEQPYREKLD